SVRPEVPPPKEEPEPATNGVAEAGISPEGYAKEAKEKNRRALLCMLRDARKKLAHHGKRSFSGKEAKKAIAAAEKEIRGRGLPVPSEGQETAEWDKKK